MGPSRPAVPLLISRRSTRRSVGRSSRRLNFRLDALQAAVLRVKLPHLEQWTGMRRANAARYGDLLKAAGLTDRVVLPVEPVGYHHIDHQYVMRVPRRDAVSYRLAAAGIGSEVYHTMPFHLQERFAPLGYQRGAFPRAEAAADSALALPVYGELTASQQDAVVTALADALSA